MLEVSKDLIERLVKIDKSLKEKYPYSKQERHVIRQNLLQGDVNFRQMRRLEKVELSNMLEMKEVAAVDGSVNQTKGESPHVIYFFQALAKTISGKEYWLTDLYTPLLQEESVEEKKEVTEKNIRSQKMSSIELKIAEQLMKKEDVKIVMMDGSLLHYSIDAEEDWKSLRQEALNRRVLLVGVTEEVGTSFLKDLPLFESKSSFNHLNDRDILFGVLEQGEMLYVEDAQRKAGLRTAWLRPSSSPAVVGIDILDEQMEHLNQIADFVFTMTPREGRGIPLWLDIVDRDVRITDKIVEALVEQYISPELKQRFFQPKKKERIY
ncbi:DNA double-strand break repair nuclease NurA [Bacillus sp. FJAT-45350]|uniref:DNA double-strand break repair nuclease NurA n=1 Tax=Bacillus sp. FJAT-45350 TaxID=2011014 RepID=UPI000BB6F013|nr:DNA double-strand break repair nuclease NurA [Bacillus sp. FJAT-45350]